MAGKNGSKRSKVFQTDIPRHTLEDALRVPRAIMDNYAGAPTVPIQVANAMDLTPNSGTFRMLCGASVAYGLASGGSNAAQIEVEPLAKRILRPTKEGDDLVARQEAVLQPRIMKEFLAKYDGYPLPKDEIAKNVLMEMGLPQDRIGDALELITEMGKSVGFIIDIKNKPHVDLSAVSQPPIKESASETEVDLGALAVHEKPKVATQPAEAAVDTSTARKHRVYITHGKNKTFIDPVKKLLEFGELEAVVSEKRSTVAKPVPDKVMDDMRSCGAAIIHIDDETIIIDADEKEHIVLNPNVLIEIGAAMALFGRRYILLVKEGITLPSNLQGLFEVRYASDTLGTEATIELLEAIRDIKNHPFPSDPST